MKISKILLILFLHCFFAKAQTEKNISQQSLLWTRYYNQLELNNKWSIHTEFDNRIFLKPVEQSLSVSRIQLRDKISNKIELGVGLAYLSVTTRDPDLDFGFITPEYRGQQDVTVKQSLDPINLSHRFQVEERWIQKVSKLQLESGTTFYLRFRYRMQGDYTIWKKMQGF